MVSSAERDTCWQYCTVCPCPAGNTVLSVLQRVWPCHADNTVLSNLQRECPPMPWRQNCTVSPTENDTLRQYCTVSPAEICCPCPAGNTVLSDLEKCAHALQPILYCHTCKGFAYALQQAVLYCQSCRVLAHAFQVILYCQTCRKCPIQAVLMSEQEKVWLMCSCLANMALSKSITNETQVLGGCTTMLYKALSHYRVMRWKLQFYWNLNGLEPSGGPRR